jgi:CDP-diacylglycerol--glycerol-3-phosphate 3-phosphatidyltransferase
MYLLITPNRLTLLRIFLLPFPCLLLLSESYSAKIGALVTGFLLGITDYLDGILARKYKKVTSIGAILDPIADKIFVSSVYLVLVYLNYFSFLPVFLIILREILVSFLRSWFPDKIKVSKIAKLKTLFQMSFAGFAVLLYIHFPSFKSLINLFLWIIAIFSYISAIPYFHKVWYKIREFRKNLKNFFISLLSLIYPLGLLLSFPLAKNLFWINIISLSFFFFKRGLVKSSPKWAYEKIWLSLFITLLLILEYIYFKSLFFSLWLILIISFLKDGLKSLKFMWRILKLQ